MKTVPNREDIEAGKKLYKEFLTEYKNLETKNTGKIKPRTNLAREMMPFCTKENIESIAVWVQDKDQFSAGIVLKNTPPGIANILGIPTARPTKSEEEAKEIIKNIFFSILDSSEEAEKMENPQTISFILYNVTIPFERNIVQLAAEELQVDQNCEKIKQEAITRIESLLTQHLGSSRDPKTIMNLLKKHPEEFIPHCLFAAATSTLRHPAPKPEKNPLPPVIFL